MSLIVENVSKAYESGIWKIKKLRVLCDISFSLKEGRVLALIGQNGAGKTTLIKCILGFVRPDSGTIAMDGKAIRSLIETGNIGYMPEKLRFPDRMTFSEYIEDLMVLRGKESYQALYNDYVQKFFMEEHTEKRLIARPAVFKL